MTQQTVRKIRRSRSRHTALWKGLLGAVGITLVAVTVFAVILGLTDVSDGVIRVINQCIKVGAIFAGVRFIVPRGDETGIRRGALLGLLYMGVGVMLYALLSGQKVTPMGYLIDVLMGLAAGGLSGMLLGSLPAKA